MKRILGLATLVILILLSLGIAIAAEKTSTAQVVVNEFVDISISICGAQLNFGSGNPGANDLPITCQNVGVPAVTITNTNMSSVALNMSVKGADFTGPAAYAVTESDWDDDNTHASPTTLTTNYVVSATNVAVDATKNLWYWIDIPSSQLAGTYTSTFYFQGLKA